MAKPAFGTPINTGHALYSGMQCCIHFWPANEPRDLVTDTQLTKTGSPTLNNNVDGGAVSGTDNTNYYSLANTGAKFHPKTGTKQTDSGAYYLAHGSVAFSVRPQTATGNNDFSRDGGGGHPCACGGYNNTCGWNLQLGSAMQAESSTGASNSADGDSGQGPPFNMTQQLNSTTTFPWSSTADDATREFHHCIVTWDSGTIAWYADGTSYASTYSLGANPFKYWVYAGHPLLIGCYDGTGNNGTPDGNFYMQGDISRVIVWNRPLTSAEAAQVTTDATAYDYMVTTYGGWFPASRSVRGRRSIVVSSGFDPGR